MNLEEKKIWIFVVYHNSNTSTFCRFGSFASCSDSFFCPIDKIQSIIFKIVTSCRHIAIEWLGPFERLVPALKHLTTSKVEEWKIEETRVEVRSQSSAWAERITKGKSTWRQTVKYVDAFLQNKSFYLIRVS